VKEKNNGGKGGRKGGKKSRKRGNLEKEK